MLSILFLLVLLISRDKGWDLELYENIFNNVNDIGIGGWIEPGFQFLILAVKSINGNFLLFNTIYSLIICCFLYSIVNRDLRYASIAVLMFFFLYYFRGPYGQIRQALAMLIFLYSLRFIVDRKMLYIFLNFIALMFHSVAIFSFVFLILASFFNLTKKRYLILISLFSIFYLAGVFSNLLTYLIGLDPNPVLMKVQFYIENANVQGGWLTPEFLKIWVISILVLLIVPEFDKLNTYRKILILSFLTGSCLYMLLSFDLRLASRSSRLFLISEFLIIAMLFEYVKNRGKLFLFILLYGSFFLIWEFYIMSKAEVIYSWS
nr:MULTISPECIES: EpsG family protein [unclassified Pseudoalteromonas]